MSSSRNDAIPPDDLLDFAAGRADRKALSRLRRQLANPASDLSRQLSETASGPESDEAPETIAGDGPTGDGETRDSTPPGDRRPAPQSRKGRGWKRTTLLVLAATGALSGLGFATWEVFFAPKTLMQDNFNRGPLDARLWDKKLCRGKVGIVDGYVRLRNRGSIVTMQEFPGPIEVIFDWRWIDVDEEPHYTDILKVVLHTSGGHSPGRPFEITDGLVVELNSVGGLVRMHREPGPEVLTPESRVAFSPGKWYRVRVTDDGAELAVYVSGPNIDPKDWKTPVLRFPHTGGFTQHRVAIYNRERAGEADHESHIDNFVIRELPRPKSDPK